MFLNLVGAFRTKVVEPAIDKRMVASGRAWVEEARRLVPVDTGQTRDSINFIYRQSDKQLILSADTQWAVFVEFGTRHMLPRPYMRPAMKAISTIWGGSGTISFPNTPPKYVEQIKNYKYRIHKGVNLKVGRGQFE